jgi:ribosomal protein S19E (S16A)
MSATAADPRTKPMVADETEYIGTWAIPRDVLHLLAAVGFVEGDAYNGWRLTADGEKWVATTLRAAVKQEILDDE